MQKYLKKFPWYSVLSTLSLVSILFQSVFLPLYSFTELAKSAYAAEKFGIKALVHGNDPTNDNSWKTGNLCAGAGGCYAEGDEVPVRLETTGLTAGATYLITVQVDHQSGTSKGYEQMHMLTPFYPHVGATNVSLSGGSLASCSGTTCLNYNIIFTATATNPTIYLDAVLSLDAADWPGSSLHMRMVTGGNTDIPINVNEIERLPSLTITKEIVDGQGVPVADQTAAAEYCFDITPQIGTKVRHCITGDGDGVDTLTLQNLLSTSYTLTEVGPDGYTFQSVTGTNCVMQSPGTGIATVASGTTAQNAVCEFKNSRAVGGLTVTKEVTGPNGEDILDTTPSFEFQMGSETFYLGDGQSENFTGLPTGMYTVTESTESGYELYSYSIDADPTTPGAQVYVNSGTPVQLLVTNRQVGGTLNIAKAVEDSRGNTIVDDTHFTFSYAPGLFVDVPGGSTTDVSGLLPGMYTVQETGIPGNYEFLSLTPDNDANSENGIVVEVLNNQTTYVHATNALKAPQVVFTKVDNVDPVTAGESFDYTLVVENTGPNNLTDVTLSDPLSDTTPFVIESYVADQGSCVIAPLGLSISCDLGDLLVGQTVTVVLTVNVPYDVASGQYTNNATVTAYEYPDGIDTSEDTEVVEEFELLVEKSSSKDLVVPGADAQFTYDLRVENLGPSDVEDVYMTDLIPAPFGLVSVSTHENTSTGTVSCTTVANDLDCTLSYLRPGDHVTLRVLVSVPVNAETGVISNTAIFTTSETGDTEWEAEDDVTIEEQAELLLVKSADALSVAAGDTFTYTLMLSNLGPSDADNAVLTDSIPSNLEILSMDNDTECSLVGNELTCNVGTLVPGAPAFVVNLLVKVDPANATEDVVNTAYATSDEDETQDEVTVGVYDDVNISAIKMHNVNPVIAGVTQFEYTIAVTNNGRSQADDLMVYDFLPEEFDYVSYSSTVGTCTYIPSPTYLAGEQIDNRFGIVVMPVDSVGDPMLECSLGDLAPGATVYITVTMDVPADVDQASNVNGVINWGWAVTDEQPADFTDQINVIEDVELDLYKTTDSGVLVAGQDNAVFTLRLVNNGASTADNVVLRDGLPTGFSFVSSTPSPDPCPGSVLPPNGYEWCVGTLEPGEEYIVELTAFVNDSVPSGIHTNRARASSDEDQTSAEADVEVSGYSTLTIDKELISNDPALAGLDMIMFSIDVINLGPSTATGVMVSDDLSEYLQSLVAEGYDLNDLTYQITTDVGNCSPLDLVLHTFTCDIGTLGVYGSQTPFPTEANIVVSIEVPAEAESGLFTNYASATSDFSDQVNDEVPFSVGEYEVISIDKSTVVTEVTAGSAENQITYTVSVTNYGPSDADNVYVEDLLPLGLELVSYPAYCSETLGVLRCELGDIPVGESVSFEYVMSAPADTVAGSYFNSAGTNSDDCVVISPARVLFDDVTVPQYCSSDSLDVTVIEDVQLDIDKVDSTDPVQAGSQFDYIITLTNLGESDADNVVVTDEIPAQLVAISVDDPACTLIGNSLTCNYVKLSTGEQKVITVTVSTPEDMEPDAIVNTVVAVSDEDEVSDEEQTMVYESADLSVEKSVEPGTATAGELTPLNYMITAWNDGPSDADNVILYDFLPDQFVLGSFTPSFGSCVVNDSFDPLTTLDPRALIMPVHTYQTENVLVCELGSVAVGEIFTLDYEMFVPSDVDATGGQGIFNVGWVVSDEQSLYFEESVEVTEDVQLSVNKTTFDKYGDLEVGHEATAGTGIVHYDIEVTNNGNSDADNVCVEDLLPDGFTYMADYSSPLPTPGGCPVNGSGTPGAIQWFFDHIPAGATEMIRVGVYVEAWVDEGVYTNIAVATSDEDTDEDTEDTGVDNVVNLHVEKTDGDVTVVAGDPVLGFIQYEITVTNYGPSDATMVTLYDSFPDGFVITDYDEDRCTVTPADWATSQFDPARWYELRCTLGELGTNGSISTQLTVWVPFDVDTGTYENYAEARDPKSTNFCGEWTGYEQRGDQAGVGLTEAIINEINPEICFYDREPVDVAEDVNLEVDKVSDPSVVNPGEEFEYQITVWNDGMSNAENVNVTDIVPDVFEILGVSTEKGTCEVLGQSVSCDIDVLHPEEEVEIVISVRALDNAVADTYTNTAVVSSDEDEGDEDSEDTEVLTIPELFITKTNDWLGSPDPLSPGDVVRYTITLSVEDLLEQEWELSAVLAEGEDERTFHGVEDVVLTDLLPTGLTFLPGTSEVVDDMGMPVPATEPTYDENTGVWSVGSIPVGGKVIVSYDAIVDGDATAGDYNDLAWAVGATPGGVQVLSQADPEDPSYFAENIVGTYVQVALPDFVETGVVLGSSVVKLPSTGIPGLISIIGLITFFLGIGLFTRDLFTRRKVNLVLQSVNKNLIGGFIATILLLLAVTPVNAQVGISLSQPDSPSNDFEFKIPYVVAVVGGESLELGCYVMTPSGASFTMFGSTKIFDKSGTGSCQVDESVISENGEYQFKVEGSGYSSEIVSVDHNAVVPAAPTAYERTETGTCTNVLKFTISSSSTATEAQIFRSTETSFIAGASTLVGEVPVTPGQQVEFTDTPSNCELTYYYSLRLVDVYGNASSFIGDEVVVTEVIEGDADGDGVPDGDENVEEPLEGDTNGDGVVDENDGEVLGEEDDEGPDGDNGSDDGENGSEGEDGEGDADGEQNFIQKYWRVLLGLGIVGVVAYWYVRRRRA